MNIQYLSALSLTFNTLNNPTKHAFTND